MEPFPYKKLIVVGTTSSGKSTLAERLANKLELDFIELDALNWGPNWTAAGDEALRARAEKATRSPGWVIAGNYRATRTVTWPRAEAIMKRSYGWITLCGLSSGGSSGVPGKGYFSKRSYGTATVNTYGHNSNSGQTSHCSIGCSRPTGGASVSIHSYLQCRKIHIFIFSISITLNKSRNGLPDS